MPKLGCCGGWSAHRSWCRAKFNQAPPERRGRAAERRRFRFPKVAGLGEIGINVIGHPIALPPKIAAPPRHVTLTPAQWWDNTCSSDSDPIRDIDGACADRRLTDIKAIRFSDRAWRAFRRHPTTIHTIGSKLALPAIAARALLLRDDDCIEVGAFADDVTIEGTRGETIVIPSVVSE